MNGHAVHSPRPLADALAHLRQGVATAGEFIVVRTALDQAEHLVRATRRTGLAGHLANALAAAAAIEIRAQAAGQWLAPALTFEEIEAIDDMLDLHLHHQLRAVRVEVQR